MTRQLKADLAILSITVVWGSSFILMKNITGNIPFYAYLFLRFSVAGAILFLIFIKTLRNMNKRVLIQGSVIGFCLFAGMALQYMGLSFTSASNSAFITGLNVVMVPVISAVFLRKAPPFKAVVGVLLATAGLFLLSGGFTGSWNRGDTLTMLCAVCFAFQIIFIDKFAATSDTRQLAFVQIVSAAILYGIFWLVMGTFEATPAIVMNGRVILTILYTGALGTAFAFGVQTIAQKYTSPTRTALIITCEPVFGAIFALTIPDTAGKTETLTLSTAAGCLLILSGMLISEIRFKRAGESPSAD